MINNIYSNLKKAFSKKVFEKLSSKIISAISALAIINASAYSGYISAQSQATIEEVVVTSRKKAEGLQDVPLSVMPLQRQSLKKRALMSLKIIYCSYQVLLQVARVQVKALYT